MSQSILIHIHGKRFARKEPPLVLTDTPLHTLTEAREKTILSAAGRGPIGYDARNERAHDEGGGKDPDVQVQIEHTVLVDHNSKTCQKHRVFWGGKRSDVTNGDASSSANQGQWKLSSITKRQALHECGGRARYTC